MDDLSAAIRSVLSDPDSMAQIQNILGSLGPTGGQPQPTAPNALQSTPQNADPIMSMLLKAAPLLSAANQEGDDARLLQALRPFLGEQRRRKLDEACRILKILHVLPLLRESGILKNIL